MLIRRKQNSWNVQQKLKLATAAAAVPVVGFVGVGAAQAQAQPMHSGYVSPESSASSVSNVKLDAGSVRLTNLRAGGGFNGAAYGPWVHKDLDLQLADIARAVYVNGPAGAFRPMGQDEIAALGIDPGLMNVPANSMEAWLYTDGGGRYVLAFRGNDGQPADIDAVARQTVGLQSGQVDSAKILAEQVKDALGDRVVFTGHSLGGGLAAIAAIDTGTTAVTFSSEGVHDNYLGPDPAGARGDAGAGQIRTYNLSQDPLLAAQRALPWVPQLGVERTLDDPNFNWLNPGDAHNIEPLINAMQLQL